jgi:nucleoside-diphosphate-sugar epimerase
MKICVTGATGFVGSALCNALVMSNAIVIKAVRSCSGNGVVAVGDIGASTPWTEAVAGCDVVVHLAARVHVMHEAAADAAALFDVVNTAAARNLGHAAATAGVKRFIFISSIKVNGEQTPPGHPFRPDDTPAPQDPYGISKMEAEAGLRAIAQETGMEVVIIRPPLVYGPGVKANFAAMVKWLQRGVPLPLGAIDNRRSLVALDNLVDLIVTCIHHPAAANQTFMVSDGEDVSTTELLRRMGVALGKPARLLPVPPRLLEWGAALAGKQDMAQRLFSSLQVDMEKTRQLLGWVPPVSLAQGLLQVAQSVQHP